MDKVKFLEKIKAIGACEDEVSRRELLAQLQEEGESDYTKLNELETTNKTLSEDNESLRAANMKLFLRIGTPSEQTQEKEKTQTKNLSYENLFNEKGELK